MESNEDFKHLNLLSIKQVCELLNRDRKTIWEWVRVDDFIKPIKVNGRTLGFLETEFEQWLQDKIKEGG